MRRTTAAMEDLFGRAYVSSATPVVLDEENEPEPDVFVVRQPFADYPDNPSFRDVLLVIEVSDTTRRFDRTQKGLLYSRAGIPEYWIVDVNGRRLLAHSQPTADGYGALHTFDETQAAACLAAPDSAVSVASLLPDRAT